MTELAKRIVQYCADHDLSQLEMARRCNVTKQTIWAIENGRENLTKLTLAKIYNVIGEKKDV